MIIKHILKMSFIFVLLVLSACTTQPEKPEYNVYKLGEEAAAAYKKKNWKLAEEKLRLLISISPGSAEMWFMLGNLYVRTSRPDKGIAAYKEAVVRRPDFEKAWRNMGIVSLRKTAHLYIEMLQHLNKETITYIQATKTSEVLLKLIKKNQQFIKGKKPAKVSPK